MSPVDFPIVSLSLADEAATAAFAARFAAFIEPGDVIALQGDLGAGKTAFARALINALPPLPGGPETEHVPSPTFTLVQTYDRQDSHGESLQIWHFDLYRLEEPEEVYELGIEEAFADGVSLIEWPERLGPLMPRNHLVVALTFGDDQGARQIALNGPKSWAERLADLKAALEGEQQV